MRRAVILSAAESNCAQFGCCSWIWTLWVNNFGIVSCCNENSGRKQWVNKRRVVRSWAYGLQHDSFSRQSYLDFLMAKTPKSFLSYLKWDFRMAEFTGWLSGMLLVRFYWPALCLITSFVNAVHQGFVNMSGVFAFYLRLNHRLMFCQRVLLILS